MRGSDGAAAPELVAALRASEQLGQLPATIWTVDRELRVTASVGEGLRLLNLPQNHTVGRTLYEHFQTDDPDHPPIAAHRLALSGQSTWYEGQTADHPAHVTVHPLRDEDGRITGCIAVSVSTSEQRRVETLLRESEGLFRQFAESIDKVVWISDSSLRRLLYLSPAYERIWGRCIDELLREPDRFRDAIHPDDRANVARSIARHRRGQPSELTYRIIRPDGVIRWVRDSSFPIRDGAGRIYRVAGIAEDITERRRDQELLATQRRILERIAQSDRVEEVPRRLCLDTEALLPGSICLIHEIEDGRLRIVAAPSLDEPLRRGLDGRPARDGAGRGRILCGDELAARWRELGLEAPARDLRAWWSTPIRARSRLVIGSFDVLHARAADPSAEDLRVLESAADLAGIALTRARAESHQRLMLRELDHRVKNNLASVMSLARQTAASCGSVDEFLPALFGRINCMSVAHELLARSQWEGADLASIAEKITSAHADRVSVSGPRLMLSPDTAPALSMALHEMTTNAAKHGALSMPRGEVCVSWSQLADGGEPRLRLQWQEQHDRPIAPPATRGLGMQLIEGLVVSQLGGRAEFRFEPPGLLCRFEVPLATSEH